ncbi:MAG: PBP1A family penicillin-binding protein [Candidatus Aminicenantes bacterium]|nr:PBP1A family penicillin-binding protein [Candidatus Aminicenantes bacterium]
MRRRVVIFSPHPTRGPILLRTLASDRVDAVLHDMLFEAEAAIAARPPDLVLIDAMAFAPEIWRRFQRLLRTLERTKILVLLSAPNPAVESLSADPSGAIVLDRIDPALIRSRVGAALREARMRNAPCFLERAWRRLAAALPQVGRKAAAGVGILAVLTLGTAGGYVLWCVSTLPSIDWIREYSAFESSRMYAADRSLLTEFFVERRTVVPIEKIPAQVRQAFVAIEDIRFYSHRGLDFRRVVGAILANIRRGEIVQGGSTITQQLVKMLLLRPDRTLTRKIKEIALAWRVEKRFSKDEILALYLNKAYFGSRAYGIEAAAQAYFGKTTAALSIADAALLAALPKAPSYYGAMVHRDQLRERRNLILDRMLLHGFITRAQFEEAAATDVPRTLQATDTQGSYFIDYCRSVLEARYRDQVYTSGFRIFTTLDKKAQDLAEKAVAAGLDRLAARSAGSAQAALLAVEIDTGRILAMVGGRDFRESQFNRATQARRQTGSTFKPFVYVAALRQGLKPSDPIIAPIVDPPSGEPGRVAGSQEPSVSLEAALAYSLNGPTMALSRRIGLSKIIRTAHELGVRSVIQPFPSTALGASEATLMEMVMAYAAMAKGYRVEPVCVDRIVDPKNTSVWEPERRRDRVLEDGVVAGIRSMLRSTVLIGTARAASGLDRPVYGKTGTTNDVADAWFIGFDDRFAVGVWVGRDERGPLGLQESGSTAALPIWVDFMRALGGFSAPAPPAGGEGR